MRVVNLGSSSSGNAVIVEFSDGSTVMFDCGFSIKELLSRASKNGISIPKTCLITHEHKDHNKAELDLRRWGVDIVRESRKSPFFIRSFCGKHDIEVKGFVVKNYSTKETVMYATDTSYIPQIKGITHMLIECNYDFETLMKNNFQRFKNVVGRHFGLDDVIRYLERFDMSKLEEIYLCHTSRENLEPYFALSEVKQLTGLPVYMMGYDGGTFTQDQLFNIRNGLQR